MSREVDIEKDFEKEEEEGRFEITTPFDPKDVDITVEQATVSKLVDRLRHGEIDLFPEFQRSGNLWDNARMSQLIESLLIKLPLPAFYIDVADEDKWIVVDGLQRLSSFQKFMVDKKLKLTQMEFLKQLDGLYYDELDRVLQRRIDETQVTLFKIRKGTPKKVLTSLFHRINTGGLKLTSQEIRHALNQGPASKYLNSIANSDWFPKYIKVSSKRMLDKELMLRFMAFYRRGYKSYKPSLQLFLDDEMEYLNDCSSEEERLAICSAFEHGLELSFQLFGDKMFSKALIEENRRVLINRSLFETTSVNLAYLSSTEANKLLANKESFIHEYKDLLKDTSFEAAITANTNRVDNVEIRHEQLQEIVTKYTGHDYQPRD